MGERKRKLNEQLDRLEEELPEPAKQGLLARLFRREPRLDKAA